MIGVLLGEIWLIVKYMIGVTLGDDWLIVKYTVYLLRIDLGKLKTLIWESWKHWFEEVENIDLGKLKTLIWESWKHCFVIVKHTVELVLV
jgi:hypothetical protein